MRSSIATFYPANPANCLVANVLAMNVTLELKLIRCVPVADGRITGGGPANQNLRSVYLASGWRPYSFVFSDGEWDQEFVSFLGKMRMDPSVGKDGKLYVPFRGLDPIAGSLAMVADAVEYARYEDDQDLVAQVILGGVWGLYNYIGQQPWLTALSSVTGAFSSTIENPKASFKAAIEIAVFNL